MIGNRRSFLKGIAGVIGMITGGALLPRTSSVNACDKVLLVNGKEVAKYLEAAIYPNTLHVTLGEEKCKENILPQFCLLYTSPSPRDRQRSRMPSSA